MYSLILRYDLIREKCISFNEETQKLKLFGGICYEQDIYMVIRVTDWIITRIYRRYSAYSLVHYYRSGRSHRNMREIQEEIQEVIK